jgi:hypothetical protein
MIVDTPAWARYVRRKPSCRLLGRTLQPRPAWDGKPYRHGKVANGTGSFPPLLLETRSTERVSCFLEVGLGPRQRQGVNRSANTCAWRGGTKLEHPESSPFMMLASARP